MAANLAILDYGSGNLRSVAKAFERVITEKALNFRVRITNTPDDLRAAQRIILPGVGAFGACRAGLEAISGMIAALEAAVLGDKKPFLGICVGMQLMADRGLEFGTTRGLGWIPGEIRKITPAGPDYKIPHIGWNELETSRSHPVFSDSHQRHAYFVHSYQFMPQERTHILAVTDHGGEVIAAIGRDNMLGVQFHPEKSQKAGLDLIARFLDWEPQMGASVDAGYLSCD